MLALTLVFAASLYLIGIRADRIHAGRAVTEPGHELVKSGPDRPGSVTVPVRYRGLTASEWAAKYRQMRTLAYARLRRSRSLRRTLMNRPSVGEAIGLAATTYGVSESFMRSLAACESGMNPGALNPSSSTGLFQILVPSTWRTTPYAGFSPWSAYANAMAAGFMLSHGRRHEWVC